MGYIQEAEHSATLASQRFGKIRTTIRYPHERVARIVKRLIIAEESLASEIVIRLHGRTILDDRKRQKKKD